MSTEAQIKASVKYNKSRDYFGLRPDKETGARIRAAAEKAGQSVQRYILDAVEQRISKEERKRTLSYEIEKCTVCNGRGYMFIGEEPSDNLSSLEFAIDNIDRIKLCEHCDGVGLRKMF